MIERAKEEDRGCSFSPLPARIKVRMCRSSRHNSERSSVKDVLLCDIYLSSSYPLRSPRNTTMLIYLVSCSIPSSCQFFNFVASTDFSNFPNFRLSARRPFMQKKLAKEKGGQSLWELWNNRNCDITLLTDLVKNSFKCCFNRAKKISAKRYLKKCSK